MTVRAICRVDHRPAGAGPGYVVATFASMQEANDRGLEESYPRCSIEYVEDPASPDSELNREVEQ